MKLDGLALRLVWWLGWARLSEVFDILFCKVTGPTSAVTMSCLTALMSEAKSSIEHAVPPLSSKIHALSDTTIVGLLAAGNTLTRPL